MIALDDALANLQVAADAHILTHVALVAGLRAAAAGGFDLGPDGTEVLDRMTVTMRALAAAIDGLVDALTLDEEA